MAQCLVGLREYPRRIAWGGAPTSVDPYVYAAILFLSAGDKHAAKSALDKGLLEYTTSTPRPYWQNVRLQRFQACRILLLRAIDGTVESKLI
jgi:hypothetical protein